MKILMISLDKKILDPTSAVANRMIEYGKTDELFILIPDENKREIVLSPTVKVFSTGGNKIQQYFRLKKMGLELMKKYDIKFVTVQDPSFSGNVGRFLKQKTGATLEMQLHGDFYGSDFYKQKLKDRIGYFFFGKRNILAADKVRVVSERVKQTLLQIGIEERKIRVKAILIVGDGGVVTPVEDYDVKIKFTGHEKYFLFAGRFEEVKNISWLLKIFSDIVHEYNRDFFLLIVGEGSQREQIQNDIQRLNLQSYVQLRHWSNNMRQLYTTTDCVLFPSQSEGYGLVPMEAVQAGTKVIMNDVGVANFELKPSDTVKIIPTADRDAWVQAILSI